MAKKLSPRERLDEKGRAACLGYNPLALRCVQCAQARLQRFCGQFKPAERERPAGGLF